jgi:hypothetical protein
MQIEDVLDELSNKIKLQMEVLADACKECLAEAEIALNLREGWVDDLKKEEEKEKKKDEKKQEVI